MRYILPLPRMPERDREYPVKWHEKNIGLPEGGHASYRIAAVRPVMAGE